MCIRDRTQTAYAVYSAKEKAKSSVSDFKRGMVQEQQPRQTGRLEKQEQHRLSLIHISSMPFMREWYNEVRK